MGVSLSDLIALAKAGYTPANVKELITLSETVDAAKTEEPQGAAAATDEPKTVSPEPEKPTAPENASEQATQEETVDYKALYEKTAEELKAAQQANRSQSAPEEDSDQMLKNLGEVISSYM